MRDLVLPPEYAKALEGLLVKAQENDRMSIEIELKHKMVRTAELEADADKIRQLKQAEARAAATVLEAKAQADAMQHTLPLKEKQIQQSRLEAEARKETTLKNAEADAQALEASAVPAVAIDPSKATEDQKETAEGLSKDAPDADPAATASAAVTATGTTLRAA